MKQATPVMAKTAMTQKAPATLPLLIPIESRVISGNNNGLPAVKIGDQIYQAPPLADGATDGMQVCVVDRTSLELIENKSFATGSVNYEMEQQEMTVFLDGYDSTKKEVLVIISSIGKSPLTWAPDQKLTFYLTEQIAYFGDNFQLESLAMYEHDFTYSLIGFPGANGNGFVSSSLGRTNDSSYEVNIQGSLLQGINNEYSFVYPEFIKFQTNYQNGVVIGDQNYDIGPLNGTTGGFQVCLFERDTLKLVKNATFATGDANIQPQKDMYSLLEQQLNKDVLVVITSVGEKPLWKNEDNLKDYELTFDLMAIMAESYGATLVSILKLTESQNHTYSFMGYPGLEQGLAPQAGSVINGGGLPNVTGVLHKNKSGFYEAAVYNSVNEVNYDFYTIIYNPPGSWPLSTKKEDILAYQYISNAVQNPYNNEPKLDNIRASYANLSQSLSTYQNALNVLKYPKGESFSEATFNTVAKQLDLELGYAESTRKMFTNIKGLITELAAAKQSGLSDVVTNLSIPKTSKKKSSSLFWDELIRSAVMFAAVVDPDPVSKALLGVASVGLYLGMAFSNSSGDEATATTEHSVVNLLKKGNYNAFMAAATANGINETLVLSDWNKLKYFGENIAGGKETGWFWGPDLTQTIVTNMQPGIRLSFYKILMPIKWDIVEFKNVSFSSPDKYHFGEGIYNWPDYPYKNAPSYAYWKGSNNAPWNLYLITNGDTDYPQESLTTDLFQTIGVSKTNFFWNIANWNLKVKSPITYDA